jgi:hypothetical protein
MCILRPSMNVHPLSFDAYPSGCRRWIYVLCLSVCQWMCVLLLSMNVRSSVCHRWMCVPVSSRRWMWGKFYISSVGW